MRVERARSDEQEGKSLIKVKNLPYWHSTHYAVVQAKVISLRE
jgi:hypothetical protein